MSEYGGLSTINNLLHDSDTAMLLYNAHLRSTNMGRVERSIPQPQGAYFMIGLIPQCYISTKLTYGVQTWEYVFFQNSYQVQYFDPKAKHISWI